MRIQTVVWLSLVVSAVGVPAAQAQYTLPPAGSPQTGTSQQGEAVTDGQPSAIIPQVATLSQWLTYDYGDFGPVGDGIPVLSEVFIRSGFAIPTAAGPLGNIGKSLDLGWEIEGGGKLLFFNQPLDSAWTLWASISNAANRGMRGDITYRINDIVLLGVNPFTGQQEFGRRPRDVSVASYNRTYVNLGIGHEWYLLGSANTPDNRWRVGVDGGGRWGSAIVRLFQEGRLNDVGHRTDVIGAVFASCYIDYAIPVGACTILTGVRGEWDYTWSDILQGANDLMSINTLFTLGLLF